MADDERGGRANQRRRTRKDLLEAAGRLMRRGSSPTLEEVAQEALVSRATAYRYFAGVEPVLAEAALDLAFPDPASFFAADASADPVERLRRAERAVEAMVADNEPALRIMLAESLGRAIRSEDETVPARQNRRTPLIDAALAPSRNRFAPRELQRLRQALALVVGTEAMLVFKDVLQLSAQEARAAKDWTIAALVDAALNGSQTHARKGVKSVASS